MALFRDKMKNWKPGRMVRLKPIVTDGVLMKLVVYPNGIDSDCAGHVSIAIENHGMEDLELESEIRIKDKKANGIIGIDPGYVCIFSRKFFPHGDLPHIFKRKWNTLEESYEDEEEFENDDKELEIHWTINSVWKNVHDALPYNGISSSFPNQTGHNGIVTSFPNQYGNNGIITNFPNQTGNNGIVNSFPNQTGNNEILKTCQSIQVMCQSASEKSTQEIKALGENIKIAVENKEQIRQQYQKILSDRIEMIKNKEVLDFKKELNEKCTEVEKALKMLHDNVQKILSDQATKHHEKNIKEEEKNENLIQENLLANSEEKIGNIETMIKTLREEVRHYAICQDQIKMEIKTEPECSGQPLTWENMSIEDKRRLIPFPKCSGCKNDMGPCVVMKQCKHGHLICWMCSKKIPLCLSCKEPYNHRAEDIEKYIQLLFQS